MSYYEKLCEKVSKEYSEFLEEMESVDSDAAKEREEERIKCYVKICDGN